MADYITIEELMNNTWTDEENNASNEVDFDSDWRGWDF